jgi:hypothetical protein
LTAANVDAKIAELRHYRLPRIIVWTKSGIVAQPAGAGDVRF